MFNKLYIIIAILLLSIGFNTTNSYAQRSKFAIQVIEYDSLKAELIRVDTITTGNDLATDTLVIVTFVKFIGGADLGGSIQVDSATVSSFADSATNAFKADTVVFSLPISQITNLQTTLDLKMLLSAFGDSLSAGIDSNNLIDTLSVISIVTDSSGTKVNLSDAQTIGGIKTFISTIVGTIDSASTAGIADSILNNIPVTQVDGITDSLATKVNLSDAQSISGVKTFADNIIANNKIGINVAVPDSTLDVSGSGKFSGNLLVEGEITGLNDSLSNQVALSEFVEVYGDSIVRIETVPNDSLTDYYPFDFNADSYGNARNDGTVSGATLIDTGFVSGAISLDGIIDIVNIDGAVTPLASTTVGTWEAWIKPTDATPVTSQDVIGFGDTNVNEFIRFTGNNAGKVLASARDAGANQWVLETDDVVLLDNEWTYIAIVQDGVSPVLYINGIAVNQTFTTSTDKTKWFSDMAGLDNGRIGAVNRNNTGDALFFGGQIDEVKLYKTALTAEQIRQNYLDSKHFNAKNTQIDLNADQTVGGVKTFIDTTHFNEDVVITTGSMVIGSLTLPPSTTLLELNQLSGNGILELTGSAAGNGGVIQFNNSGGTAAGQLSVFGTATFFDYAGTLNWRSGFNGTVAMSLAADSTANLNGDVLIGGGVLDSTLTVTGGGHFTGGLLVDDNVLISGDLIVTGGFDLNPSFATMNSIDSIGVLVPTVGDTVHLANTFELGEAGAVDFILLTDSLKYTGVDSIIISVDVVIGTSISANNQHATWRVYRNNSVIGMNELFVGRDFSSSDNVGVVNMRGLIKLGTNDVLYVLASVTSSSGRTLGHEHIMFTIMQVKKIIQ